MAATRSTARRAVRVRRRGREPGDEAVVAPKSVMCHASNLSACGCSSVASHSRSVANSPRYSRREWSRPGGAERSCRRSETRSGSMAGGMDRPRTPYGNIADRIAATQGASCSRHGSPSRDRPVERVRHCWVTTDDHGRVPALLLEWRETPDGWQGRVVRPVLDTDDGRWMPRHQEIFRHPQSAVGPSATSLIPRRNQPLVGGGSIEAIVRPRNGAKARSLRRQRSREGKRDGRVRDLSGQQGRVPVPLPGEHRGHRCHQHRVPNQGRGKKAIAAVFGAADGSTIRQTEPKASMEQARLDDVREQGGGALGLHRRGICQHKASPTTDLTSRRSARIAARACGSGLSLALYPRAPSARPGPKVPSSWRWAGSTLRLSQVLGRGLVGVGGPTGPRTAPRWRGLAGAVRLGSTGAAGRAGIPESGRAALAGDPGGPKD